MKTKMPDARSAHDCPPSVTLRADLHCHSRASRGSATAWLGRLDIPECVSPPEAVYDQARSRGMDLIAITDHDVIDGAMELVERGFEHLIVGQEVTVHFPEDHCKLHVLVWGLTPDQHEQIAALELRDDVYAFAHWIHDQQLAHALAHPLVSQNGRLEISHLERCALLFKGWEVLNGAHPGSHRPVIERFLATLSPPRMTQLARKHGFQPLWMRSWLKARTAGSDDHALLNIGRTWTELTTDEPIRGSEDFLRWIMAGRGSLGGRGGESVQLAHQIAGVGARVYAERRPRTGTRSHYVASKLLSFAGASVPRPTKPRLLVHALGRRFRRSGQRSLPILDALRDVMRDVLREYPELEARLDPSTWTDGPALAEHERMVEFTEQLSAAMMRAMSGGAMRAVRQRDPLGIADHLLSYLLLLATDAPYLFAIGNHNKERDFIRELELSMDGPPDESKQAGPMRLALFTDTLEDVNGVARFINDIAEHSVEQHRLLRIFAPESEAIRGRDDIQAIEAIFSFALPQYPQQQIILPHLRRIVRQVDAFRPDVIHVSTPGPIGLAGVVAAKLLHVPLVGVYHTDFPAYAADLTMDDSMRAICAAAMGLLYGRFDSVLARSHPYEQCIVDLGVPAERVRSLQPAVRSDLFTPAHRDESIFVKLGAPAASDRTVRALYVGRISVEKNLRLLAEIWPQMRERCREQGVDLQLAIVGDGPYRKEMQQALADEQVWFAGVQKGEALSALYASADVFLFPSETDTLGQVVMEAMASGLPVLVSDRGGPSGLVRHAIDGLIIPCMDHEGWIRGVEQLATDPKARMEMGAAARSAAEHWTPQKMYEDFWRAHEVVVGRTASPEPEPVVATMPSNYERAVRM